MDILMIGFAVLVCLSWEVRWFADTPGAVGAGGEATTGATGGDGDAGVAGDAAPGGEGAEKPAPGGAAGEKPAAGEKAGAAGKSEAELSEFQQLLRTLDPETAEYVYRTAEADSKRLDREEATAAKKKTEAAEKASAAGDSDARLVAAEKRLAELEGKEQREQKRASLEKWVTGISAGIAKEDLAKDLDDPAREILTKLAMGHGALDRQLDAGKAVESFVKDAGAVIDKLAEVKAEARLVEWKRDFLAGKVRAATTTAGEGATGAPPDHGGEKHDASDLDSGKTKDRALQRQKLRAAGV